jgi:hypothetical protein
LISKDFVDFVEFKARVHKDEYVGISSSKERPQKVGIGQRTLPPYWS